MALGSCEPHDTADSSRTVEFCVAHAPRLLRALGPPAVNGSRQRSAPKRGLGSTDVHELRLWRDALLDVLNGRRDASEAASDVDWDAESLRLSEQEGVAPTTPLDNRSGADV